MPNDIWQADHTELDVMVLDEAGRPARPWLTVILDDHSRAVAGYTRVPRRSDRAADRVGVAAGDLAQDRPGAGRCAACRRSCTATTAPTSPAPTLTQVCADLKVQLIHSAPGQPRGRGKVERAVRDDHHRAAADPARVHPTRQPRPAGHRAEP